jgi:hypothetical protein
MNMVLAKLHQFDNANTLRNAFILFGGLAVFAHIAFVLPAVYALIRLSRLGELANISVESRPDLYLWLPATLLGAVILFAKPLPMDDLLSMVALGQGSFSHQSFAYSDWSKLGISPWFGLEEIIGVLANAFGGDAAMRGIQLASVVVTLVSLTLAAKKILNGRNDLAIHVAILLGLILATGIIQRAIGGRAETFFVAWGIAAIWMPAKIWLPIGMLMTPLYWLSWIYAPMALLLNGSIKTKLIAGMVYGVTAVGVWLWMHGANYPEMFALTSEWVSTRQVEMSENIQAIASVFLSPASLVLVSLILFAGFSGWGSIKNDWHYAIVIAWFLIPDMARYTPLALAIGGFWLIAGMSKHMTVQKLNLALVPLLVAVALVLIKTIPAETGSHPQFKIPEGSILMGSVSSALQETIKNNPGIFVTPSFEVGATEQDVQKAMLSLIRDGEFDCKTLDKYPVDFLIENSLKSIPSCLVIDQIDGGWRLWKTKGSLK